MFYSTFLRRAKDYRAYRGERARIFAELSGYSDRELNDLGIARADIPAVASRAARQKLAHALGSPLCVTAPRTAGLA